MSQQRAMRPPRQILESGIGQLNTLTSVCDQQRVGHILHNRVETIAVVFHHLGAALHFVLQLLLMTLHPLDQLHIRYRQRGLSSYSLGKAHIRRRIRQTSFPWTDAPQTHDALPHPQRNRQFDIACGHQIHDVREHPRWQGRPHDGYTVICNPHVQRRFRQQR